MGVCFLYGNSGGGEAVKKVYGGLTAPTSPSEDSVWVKTDQNLSDLLVCNSKFIPFNRAGRIWIKYEDVVATSYQWLLLKNTKKMVSLCLSGCVIGDGSMWRNLDAYLYYHGEFHQFSSVWDGTLFYNGNQYANVTGGWTGANSYSPNLTATLYSGTITISTVSAVDLSGFSTLKFTGSGNGANSGGAYSAKCKIFNESGGEVASIDFQNNGTYAVSVAALSGKHYVRFTANGSRGNNLNISKVWLE